jgi:hypothetical protein
MGARAVPENSTPFAPDTYLWMSKSRRKTSRGTPPKKIVSDAFLHPHKESLIDKG